MLFLFVRLRNIAASVPMKSMYTPENNSSSEEESDTIRSIVELYSFKDTIVILFSLLTDHKGHRVNLRVK